MPFTFGCFGPGADGRQVTDEECCALYDGCGSSGQVLKVTVDAAEGEKDYKLWCPCSGNCNTNAPSSVATTTSTTTPSATTPTPTVTPSADSSGAGKTH